MKAWLIYNPVAGPRDAREGLQKALRYLQTRGWDIELIQTRRPGDAERYAREAWRADIEMVISAGGDGTLGEIANGLVGSDCSVGVLPVGTGNVWAHMLGLPVWTPVYRSALLDAARVLINGEHRRIDLGKAGERYFVLWMGVGFDAQVARNVEPHREIRRNLGNLTYWVAAIAESVSMRGTAATVTIDGEVIRQRVLLILVSNAQIYGPSLQLAPQARLDDGLLDICIFEGANGFDAVRHFALLAMGRHAQSSRIQIYRGKKVVISTDTPLPLHTDGDPSGHTPIKVEVVPHALQVVVPEWVSESLFEGGNGQAGRNPPIRRRITARLRSERAYLRKEAERIRLKLDRNLPLDPPEPLL